MKKTLSLLTVIFLHNSVPDFNTYFINYFDSAFTAHFFEIADRAAPIIAFGIQPPPGSATNPILPVEKEKYKWNVNCSIHQGMLSVDNASVE